MVLQFIFGAVSQPAPIADPVYLATISEREIDFGTPYADILEHVIGHGHQELATLANIAATLHFGVDRLHCVQRRVCSTNDERTLWTTGRAKHVDAHFILHQIGAAGRFRQAPGNGGSSPGPSPLEI
jgi:hypothetical protein